MSTSGAEQAQCRARLGRAAAVRTNRQDQGSEVMGLAVGWSGGDESGLQWGRQHWEIGQWTAQGLGESRAKHG